MKVGLSIESFMHISNEVSSITGTVYEHNLYIGMVDQQSDQFASRIACSSYDSNSYHNSSLWLA